MPSKLKVAAMVGGGLAALIVVVGAVTRVKAGQDMQSWSEARAIPTVALATVQSGEGDRSLVLPGDVEAFNSAAIQARVPGYLKRWYVDIGAPVKAGQVLAEIDTPDLDQQLAQAQAALVTAQANEKLARTTSARWSQLLAQDAVSRQDADEKAGDLAAKSALTAAALANVRQLAALAAFKRITAPFAGVVTSRSADIGQLIAAGAPASAPLFTVADETRLRVYVRVPQNYTAQVQRGMTATLTVPEYPGRTFEAKLVNTSGAIAAGTGAQLCELWIDNADHALKPGEYAQVRFSLPPVQGAVQLPSSALLIRHSGPAVAIVGPGARVAIKPVTLTADLGAVVEIAAGGVSGADRVIDNPTETLQPGDIVRIAGASAEAQASAQTKTRRADVHG